VVAAVVEAAAQLFAEHGPAGVSLRDVARAADVNLGLIHRHIGSKEDLLAAVLRARPGMLATDYKSPEDVVARFLETGFSPPPFTLILVRAALDGYDLASLGVEFPVVGLMRKMLRERFEDVDADLLVALLTATLLGWHAMGRTMLQVLDRTDLDAADVVAFLEPALAALFAPPA